MKKKINLRRFSIIFVGLIMALTACGDAIDRIGERPIDTDTPAVQRTATPGGVVSIWMETPTGQAGGGQIASTPRGEMLAPAATATALTGTLTAATLTAAAPPAQPNFQPDECPEPSGRVPEPRPSEFSDFPAAIGTYLSDGGPTTVLESELRNWGAITDEGGIVQGDTDLTGDGIHEIIVSIYNPFAYNDEAFRNAGQMLIYGCDNGGYRLLYATVNSPGQALPVLHRVGDMNGDVRAEIVYDIESCTYTYCLQEGQIITWNPITGTFVPLNNAPIVTLNGRLSVSDVDEDGILEVRAISNAAFEQRVVDIWDWTGRNYVLALRE
jgi:hypothetical protein